MDNRDVPGSSSPDSHASKECKVGATTALTKFGVEVTLRHLGHVILV